MRITRKRYDRVAPFYDDLLEKPTEVLQFAQWRARLGERISGGDCIPEVGVGTGKNIRHFPQDARVTAIDISPRMLADFLRC